MYSFAPLILSDKVFHITNENRSGVAIMRRQDDRAPGLACMHVIAINRCSSPMLFICRVIASCITVAITIDARRAEGVNQ